MLRPASLMRNLTARLLCLFLGFALFAAGAAAQGIPRELWGKWVIRHEVPTPTISCWGETEARAIVGTEIEYTTDSFRWKDVTVKHANAEVRIVSAKQFHDENSGGSVSSSQVTFHDLGIALPSATQITIEHPAASITGATTEIPGDVILVKDHNTIILSVCSIYFEAKRVGPSRHKATS
jgi:hypothetical protein